MIHNTTHIFFVGELAVGLYPKDVKVRTIVRIKTPWTKPSYNRGGFTVLDLLRTKV